MTAAEPVSLSPLPREVLRAVQLVSGRLVVGKAVAADLRATAADVPASRRRLVSAELVVVMMRFDALGGSSAAAAVLFVAELIVVLLGAAQARELLAPALPSERATALIGMANNGQGALPEPQGDVPDDLYAMLLG